MVDSTLYLYTSLTAGSSHIITATSRLETILKANKIPFRAIDCATDEKARQLWGRRAKGKKIPGLVKYGQVIGDLEQVEEWNEFGELKESVNSVSDIFGDTPMTDTPMAPPVNTLPPNPINPIVERPSPSISRSSSETRHISISEPKDSRDKEHPAASIRRDDSPLALAMRHAGAEAAAKAGSKKTATSASPNRSAAIDVPSEVTHIGRRPSETTTVEINDPAVTDAKTPAQLSAEGHMRRSSTDRSADRSGRSSPDSDRSNEEQVLNLRRRSSIVRSTSHLAEGISVDDLDKSQPPTEEGVTGTKLHHGNNVTQVPQDMIEQIEKENLIKEEDEEDDEEDEVKEKLEPAAKISATDTEEAKVIKGKSPQEGKAAAADEAGASVGD